MINSKEDMNDQPDVYTIRYFNAEGVRRALKKKKPNLTEDEIETEVEMIREVLEESSDPKWRLVRAPFYSSPRVSPFSFHDDCFDD